MSIVTDLGRVPSSIFGEPVHYIQGIGISRDGIFKVKCRRGTMDFEQDLDRNSVWPADGISEPDTIEFDIAE